MLPPPNAGPVSSHLGSPAPQPDVGREPREVLLPKPAVTVPEYKAHRHMEFATGCCGAQTFRPLFRPSLSDSFGAETGQFWGHSEEKQGVTSGFKWCVSLFCPCCAAPHSLRREAPVTPTAVPGRCGGSGRPDPHRRTSRTDTAPRAAPRHAAPAPCLSGKASAVSLFAFMFIRFRSQLTGAGEIPRQTG